MPFRKKIKNEIIFLLGGIQEAVYAVAERINDRVKKIKTRVELDTVESAIQDNFSKLGRLIYQSRKLNLDLLKDDNPEVNRILSTIRAHEKKRDAIRYKNI